MLDDTQEEKAKEYVKSVTVKNWEQRQNYKNSTLTITAKGMNGKKVTVKTTGHMTVGQIVDTIAEALKDADSGKYV